MPATVPVVQPCADFNTSSCTSGSDCAYFHGPDSFSVSTGGRNVCLAFLAELHCAGCSYSHQRHDVSTLDDDELTPIVQQKLQEIGSWITRTQQWFLSPAPGSPAPFASAPPSAPYRQRPPYSANHVMRNTASFANTDPSKVVEFKPRGLQLPTPTSPKSLESLSNAPNEDPAAFPIEPAQDNTAFEATAGWGNGGWVTPESNPCTNTENKKLEESAEGKESKAKLDWAEDADRNLPIYPLSTGGWDEPKATGEIEASEEKHAEVTKDQVDAWAAENGWSMETTNGWDDPPKVAKPTGDIHLDTHPGNAKLDTKYANENDWNTIPKGKKSKWATEKSLKSPPLTPKPRNRDSGFHKGPAEKDQKTWRKGRETEGLAKSTTPLESSKKGKKGGKSSPTLPAAKPSAITNTKFGPTKEKVQAAGSKDAFTFNRITPSPATPQGTRTEEEDILRPDPDSLPALPPDLKDAGYSPEMELKLRQAVVSRRKMPNQPSVAPLLENTTNDKGTSWVNGTLETGWNTDPSKVFSERKVDQMNEENGWHRVPVKRSDSKASSSPATEGKMEDWPKLGK